MELVVLPEYVSCSEPNSVYRNIDTLCDMKKYCIFVFINCGAKEDHSNLSLFSHRLVVYFKHKLKFHIKMNRDAVIVEHWRKVGKCDMIVLCGRN